MPLPSAVRRRADEVRARDSEAKANPEPEQTEQVVALAPAPQRESTPSEPQQERPAPQASEDSSDPPQPQAPQHREGFISPDDYEGRYKALRSARDERKAALENDNASLKRRVEELESQISRRETLEPPSERKRFEIDEQSREYIGDTEAKLFENLASSTQADIDELRAEQKRSRDREQRELQTTREAFFEKLDSLVPQWQRLNEDAVFLRWLSQEDSSTGETRQALLNGFVDRNDSRRASLLFKAFDQNGNQAPAQPAQPEYSPEVPTQRPAGRGAEEQLVEIYSPDEVSDFFARKSSLYRAKKLHGETLVQIQAEEAKIRQAIADGRVG